METELNVSREKRGLERRKLLRSIQTCGLETAAPGSFFELPGGRVTEYFNIKRACANRDLHVPLAAELHGQLAHFEAVDAVAGIAVGGCHLASIVAFRAAESGHPLDALFVRKTPKKSGRTPGFVEGYIRKGAKVVILDDVIGAGRSVMAAAAHLCDAGLDVRGAIAVVDNRAEPKGALPDGTPVRSLFLIGELVCTIVDAPAVREDVG